MCINWIPKPSGCDSIKLAANKSRYVDCLNEADDATGNKADMEEIKAKADELYKEKGFSNLPFLEKQSVLKEYFY